MDLGGLKLEPKKTYSYKTALSLWWLVAIVIIVVSGLVYYQTRSIENSLMVAFVLFMFALASFVQVLFYQYQLKRRGYKKR